jgi:hypothetical protein
MDDAIPASVKAKMRKEIDLFEKQWDLIHPHLPDSMNAPRLKMLIIRLVEAYGFENKAIEIATVLLAMAADMEGNKNVH